MWELTTNSEAETIALGSAIGAVLRPGDVVMLEGELGSGKTRLAKGMVSAAADVPQDEVVSPTFTLVNTFEGAFPVHHADLYRLEPHQLGDLGFEDALDEGGALVIEWAEKLRDVRTDALLVVIRPAGSANSRLISIQCDPTGPWQERIEEIVESFR
ncbi:MAG: tRNA (adenosine(37)-N6)-threonylcarbamoyltransferase complex ATPase subunit type 1 TsaE [Desulfomonile sp.]|nr:tRNA (adenosine(37)-N6)-threonylcarbamoyltransferase complex ATPase subunit type 1 TsaE [Desulfomonile sp.]